MKKDTRDDLKEQVVTEKMVEQITHQESFTQQQEQQETAELEQIQAESGEEQREEVVLKERETQEEKPEAIEENEMSTQSIDWSSLKATQSRAVEKASGEEGICTIVNCEKNGNKRMSLASKLLIAIGNPKEIEVGIMPNGIAIAEKLPIEANMFTVKELGAKKVIYAGALVKEITKEFNLDYSQRTSITFQKVIYDEVKGYKIALIKMK